MSNETVFLEKMADVLEVHPGQLSLETDFRENIDNFDSLMGYMMITTIEENFNVLISVDDFIDSRTLGALYTFINSSI